MRQPWKSYKSRLTSTGVNAYFDRSKHVDRLEVNAYFGRSKTTLIYALHVCYFYITRFSRAFCRLSVG